MASIICIVIKYQLSLSALFISSNAYEKSGQAKGNFRYPKTMMVLDVGLGSGSLCSVRPSSAVFFPYFELVRRPFVAKSQGG
jgi:hypothetical protein